MDEGRKHVVGIMAAILASLHMRTADDLFGGPQGSPRTDKLITASIQWAEKITDRRRCVSLGALMLGSFVLSIPLIKHLEIAKGVRSLPRSAHAQALRVPCFDRSADARGLRPPCFFAIALRKPDEFTSADDSMGRFEPLLWL